MCGSVWRGRAATSSGLTHSHTTPVPALLGHVHVAVCFLPACLSLPDHLLVPPFLPAFLAAGQADDEDN
jgi:hypothetical protein